MTTQGKGIPQWLTALLCLAATGGSALWIYYTQLAAPKFNVSLRRAIGRTLAQETAKLLNPTGKVVLVSMEWGGVPELKAQLDEFERTLKQFPKIILDKTYKLETDD